MINCPLLLRQLMIASIVAILLFSPGCVPSTPPEQPAPPVGQEQPPADVEKDKSALSPSDTESTLGQNATCPQAPDPRKILISERERDRCYHLQPGTVSTKKKGHRMTHQKTSQCQPQSLIYARCRTVLSSCRLGDTSPVQWFTCARKSGNTTSVPVAGSVMVLDGNSKRGMSTGHPVYVEQVKANGNGTWHLRISHTNYDRKCHLDLDAKVLFDPVRMSATFESGPWGCWANGLKVMGFILR
jgi:hypothetical protein